MAFFDDLKEKVSGLASTGMAKSRQLGEMAKLKANSLAEEDTIKKAYLALGKLYYAERGMAPETAYAALCEKITAAKVNIEENKSRMEQLKAESGVNDLVEDVQQAGASVKQTLVEPLAEKVRDTAGDVKDATRDFLDRSKDAVENLSEKARDAAEKAADAMKDVAENLKDDRNAE